ncbi:hypothetical protein SBADM41S_01787 [Streptomyces badius]
MPSIRSHGHHDAQLVRERGQPVVAVGQHDDLPVVTGLEELLRAPVHIADLPLCVLDALAVQHDPQPEDPVRRGVLGADVEHHVGALRRSADADRRLRHAGQYSLTVRSLTGAGGGCHGAGPQPHPVQQPAEVAEAAARGQLRRLARRRQRAYVTRRVGGGRGSAAAGRRRHRGGAARPAGRSASVLASVLAAVTDFRDRLRDRRRAGVQRHMRGQVAGPVRTAHLALAARRPVRPRSPTPRPPRRPTDRLTSGQDTFP